jgi:hypothetical protein
VQDAPNVFKETPVYDIYEEEYTACLNIMSDVQDFTLELQQQDDERACNCSVLKASDSFATWSSQLSIEHSMQELRLLWDPGDNKISSSTLNRGIGGVLQTSVLTASGIFTLPCVLIVKILFGMPTCVTQQCHYYRVSSRQENHGIQKWDPRIAETSFVDLCLYWHDDIKFNGIALWLVTFNPP